MKKLLSVLLALALLASLAGCSLFADDSAVKLGDSYTHKDPKDLSYDTRVVLQGTGFAAHLEDFMNAAAYPDTMMYDDSGNMVGIYDYNEETGLAAGWTDLTTGAYTAFPAGEEVDLGKPDAALMTEIPGDVTLYFVVYGEKDETVSAYQYLILSDAAAKDTVKSAVESVFGVTLSEESDTVLLAVEDKDYIAAQFDSFADYDSGITARDAASYAELLKQTYGVREYTGVNPFKPYAGHEDPTDLEYDQRVVLTGSGEATVSEEYAKDVSSVTDYLYGSDGEIVGQYTYIECPSKDAADELVDNGAVSASAQRVSDTALLIVCTGKDLNDLVSAYMGYNVLKDKSVDEYVRMIEETYFSSVYE